MGSVFQQKGIWRFQYYREGRQYIESSRSHRKEDAVRLLKLREGAIAKGIPVAPKIGRLRFEEAAQDLVDEYRLNNRDSLDELERRIKLHLQPFFGRRRMATITSDDILAFTKQRKSATIKLRPLKSDDRPRERPYSNAEINRELATLKRMFNLARKREKLQFVPHFEMLKEGGARKGCRFSEG